LWLTAGLFHLMVEEQLASLRGPRHVMAGGDVLRPALVQRVLDAYPDHKLTNGYGPTEDTTFGTCYAMTGATVLGHTVPIGRPVANTTAYVLDDQLRPVPVGVAGELYLGGDGLARGYWGRPDLTAERFIPHPFLAGARLYQTGDLVRWLASGDIEFLGRRDGQVKLRGYRIEMGEIERVLDAQPGVQASLVVVHTGADGDKRLVGYVVGAGLSGTQVRADLQALLPAYLVPAAIVVLAALPLTSTGKVDRRALPDPWGAAAPSLAATELPQGPLEVEVAALWAGVLRHPVIGRHDDFFALGGNSLRATQLVARMRTAFQLDLALAALFDAPTVAQLSAFIAQERAMARASRPVPALTAHGQTAPQALSYAQERLWFLEQLQPDSALYVVALAVTLQRVLDQTTLERALAVVVARQASLRTTFINTPEGPLQVVAPTAQIPLRLVDLRGLSPAERTAAVQRETAYESQTPFQLSGGALTRLAVVRVDEAETLLLVAQHHSISDGWSLAVFLEELLASYAAVSQQQAPALPPLPVQYTDYAAWQRAWLDDGELDAQLAYWQRHLGDAPLLLDLPTDHPRPPVPSYRGIRQGFTIPAALTQQVQALSQSEGVTVYMTLLTAFEALLHRYTRQDDFLVGTVVAGRQRPELDHLIGFFVNTLPLHADLSGAPTFRAALARTRQVTLDAFAHQDVPFERIVAAVQPTRDLSYHPLIQAMFVLQNTALGTLDTPDGSVRVVETDTGTSQFDLTLEVTEVADELRGSVQYNTDIFEAATIARLVDHFLRLLTGALANPDQAVGRLPLLSDAEWQDLVVTRNATAVDIADLPFVPRAVAVQVARAPHALAVAGDATEWSYTDLMGQANQLAHYLRARGIGHEDLVAVCLDRSPAMILALLGIWQAGAGYLPIDPAYPEERRAYLVRDGGVSVVITDPARFTGLDLSGVHVVSVPDAPWRGHPTTSPMVDTAAEHLAYVIYTSGSTGQPKGVEITHGNLRNLIAWYTTYHAVGAADRLSQLVGPGFDANMLEIWAALTRGASLHIVDEETRTNPPALRDWLVDQRITVSMIPTALAEPLLGLPWPAGTALRRVFTGGEALHRYPPADFPADFINGYGPTETTVTASAILLTAHPADPSQPPPIGFPVPNEQLYLLDADLQPVPVGVVGELYVGGTPVARGYRGRPELTRERFIPDPFSTAPGARLYRTGDLCRYDAEGAIAYIGRTDGQVKLRGYRIELGEIEHALQAHPTVAQALVIAREDVPGEKQLVAYLVPQAGAVIEIAALRDALAQRLPNYMVPAAMVVMEALPLTANGKVNRRALPVPLWTAPEDDVAPRTPREAQVAAIWAEVLHRDKVGVTADFFALGGHSLLATRLITRLRAALGQEVTLRMLFAAPTVAGLVAQLGEGDTTETTTALTTIPRVARGQPLVLSAGQERLWFLDQLAPGSALYLVPAALRLPFAVVPEQLAATLRA
ncbi:MAG: amino acid adenylation domain-containing protein, partial [Ktedonobacterales bacterium]|nr:amino acid adenylation domain-containing protein [Ktedonobacterales bacterium]